MKIRKKIEQKLTAKSIWNVSIVRLHSTLLKYSNLPCFDKSIVEFVNQLFLKILAPKIWSASHYFAKQSVLTRNFAT